MRKKLLLTLISACSVVGMGVALVTASKSSYNEFSSAGLITPGSITLDASKDDVVIKDTLVTAKSALENEFLFTAKMLTKDEDKFTLTEYFANNTDINGITQIYIHALNDTYMSYEYTVDHVTMSGGDIDIKTGDNTIVFKAYNPTYFQLYVKDALSFDKLIIDYTCKADEPVPPTPSYDVTSVKCSIDGLQYSGGNIVFAKTDTLLSDLDLDSISISFDYGVQMILSGSDFSNVSITYLGEESDVVLEGSHLAMITFTYKGVDCGFSPFELRGYSSFNLNYYSTASFSNSNMRQLESDEIPEDLYFHLSARCYLFDKDGNQTGDFYFISDDISLTSEMIVNMDDHPFTELGRHVITIYYKEMSFTIDYTIYNPDYNNISYIYFEGDTITLEKGASIDDFLTIILSKTAYVGYYEWREDLPDTVTLTAENFKLTEGMFDKSGYAYVTLTYEKYVGEVYVRIVAVPGTLVQTYTNSEEVIVSVYGTYSLVKIDIYDNDVCTVYYEQNESVSSLGDFDFTYDSETKVLTFDFNNFAIKVVLNEDDNTFKNYVSSATLLYELKVDFSAFGAGAGFIYDGRLYDDNTVVFAIGADFTADFTYDTEDNTIIYFVFGPYGPCQGVIDYSAKTMVVTPIA